MHLWAQIEIHATFLAFVALAVYAQALTGFALALILLGLVGASLMAVARWLKRQA